MRSITGSPFPKILGDKTIFKLSLSAPACKQTFRFLVTAEIIEEKLHRLLAHQQSFLGETGIHK